MLHNLCAIYPDVNNPLQHKQAASSRKGGSTYQTLNTGARDFASGSATFLVSTRYEFNSQNQTKPKQNKNKNKKTLNINGEDDSGCTQDMTASLGSNLSCHHFRHCVAPVLCRFLHHPRQHGMSHRPHSLLLCSSGNPGTQSLHPASPGF